VCDSCRGLVRVLMSMREYLVRQPAGLGVVSGGLWTSQSEVQ
jgi:hypothetical protein